MKINNKYVFFILQGLVIGLVSGYYLAGFFIYMGLFFLPLFIVFAVLEKNIRRKLHWFGFIFACTVTVLITWFYILPDVHM